MDEETKTILRDLAVSIAKNELYVERITRRLYEALTPAQKEKLGTVDDLMGVERREVDEYFQEHPSMLESHLPEPFRQPSPRPGSKRPSTKGAAGKKKSDQ